MPSVLVETGFITNPDEEKYLNSEKGQDYLASSIYRACRDYLNEIDSKSGISVKIDQESAPRDDTISALSTETDEIFFMVQVASSLTKTDIKPENFKGLKDITEIYTQDRYRYAAGDFSDYSSAANYRNKIEIFYPDAFVIAVKDNKILPLQQAIEQKRKTQKDY
jgi:N-acetylmuramoyl-L-alanine amidase